MRHKHKHKHKKNGSVRFSYACAYAYVAGVLTCFSGAYAYASAYAYVLVKTRLKGSQIRDMSYYTLADDNISDTLDCMIFENPNTDKVTPGLHLYTPTIKKQIYFQTTSRDSPHNIILNSSTFRWLYEFRC